MLKYIVEMPSCFVPGCRNGYGKDCYKGNHFFRPPKDEEQFSNWARAIPRKDRCLTHKSYVCQAHFSDDSLVKVDSFIVNDKTVEIPRLKWSLKSGAVPQIFPNLPTYLSKPLKRRKSPTMRQIQQKQIDKEKRDSTNSSVTEIITPDYRQTTTHQGNTSNFRRFQTADSLRLEQRKKKRKMGIQCAQNESFSSVFIKEEPNEGVDEEKVEDEEYLEAVAAKNKKKEKMEVQGAQNESFSSVFIKEEPNEGVDEEKVEDEEYQEADISPSAHLFMKQELTVEEEGVNKHSVEQYVIPDINVITKEVDIEEESMEEHI